MERLDLTAPRFSQADVLQILPELKASTLQNWANRGKSEAAGQSPGRQGKRMYTARGLVALKFTAQLNDMLIPPSVALQFADQVAGAAQQIWDAKLEEPDEAGCPQISILGEPNLFGLEGGEQIYRRAYIWREDAKTFAFEIRRKSLSRIMHSKPVLMVEVDLLAIEVINAIHRYLYDRKIESGLVALHPVLQPVDDEAHKRWYDERLARLRALPESA